MLDAQPWRRFLPDVPPPPFCDPVDVLVETLPTLKPKKRLSVPEWAEHSRRLETAAYRGPWSNDFAPYMTEPARMTTSRRYGAVVFVGPARTVKSEALILNRIGHAIECLPRDTLVVCQTQDSAKQFSEKKLSPMLRACPSLAARQSHERGSDNIHAKKFKGGMHLEIRWPVVGYFSQNEYFTVLLTDYDRFVDDVDGEGDAFSLARKRTQQAGSLGMVVAESSPGRMIERDDWTRSSAHEAPPCGGLLSIFNQGTRGKFYWACPHCGDPFQPLFSTLHWEKRGTPAESADTVVMCCPNGCVIGPDRKAELNAGGVWLHETASGDDVCEIDDPAIRDTDIVSYWCEGPVAAMQSWKQLVLRQIEAQIQFEERGDEKPLKATITLDQGRPHLPLIRLVGDELSAEALKALAKRFPLGVAPAVTRFLTIQVDVQANRFVVSVEAWGEGLEHWLIDRFDIMTPPEVAPGAGPDETGKPRRAIDPGRYKEDWAVLRLLLDRSWPIAGSDGMAFLPRAMIVDSGGAPGVTANAYAFYRAMRQANLGHRVFVSKGIGGLNQQRALYSAPEKVLGTRRKRTTDIRIVHIGTDPLKDEVALALTRKEPGPNAFHLPESLPSTVFEEFCAEVRTDTGWQVRKHGIRNESLDLAVMARAIAIVLKAEKINWTNPPVWALSAPDNSYCIRHTTAAPSQEAETASSPSDAAPSLSRQRGGWISGRRNWLR